jgi:thiol:disulfide interchange protein DsbC
MRALKTLALVILIGLFTSNSVYSFQKAGCGGADCRSCHSFNKEEAASLLKEMKVEKINAVKLSEVPGFWEVQAMANGKSIPILIDFSKQYLISGSIIKLDTKEDLTRRKFMELNRIDPALVPLNDAIIIGDPKASQKIILFDDPECSYCKKIHPLLKKISSNPKNNIAFYVKMFPLPMHPNAYDKAKSIICNKSAKMLEDSLLGKKIPKPSCKTDQVDKNIKLARKLKINSTPTLLFPNGIVNPGYITEEQILDILTWPKAKKE